MAYQIGYDITIDDNNCIEFGEACIQYAEKFENYLKNYIECLDKITQNGISSGDVAKNLKTFQAKVEKLKGSIDELTKIVKKDANRLIKSTDNADSFLF